MYMLTIADQTRLFLLALGLGFLLGIVYDLFRVVRMAFTMRRVGVFIQDVLFFLTCAAATFLFCLPSIRGRSVGLSSLGRAWVSDLLFFLRPFGRACEQFFGACDSSVVFRYFRAFSRSFSPLEKAFCKNWDICKENLKKNCKEIKI